MPKGGGKGKKRKRKTAEEDGKTERRKWGDAPDKILKNVKYTAKENEKLLKAFQAYCTEKNTTLEALAPELRDERQRYFVWGRIAKLAEVDTRSVQSMSQRLRRILFADQGGQWSEEQLEALIDECLTSGNLDHKWKIIAARIGKSPEMCRDRWKHLYGHAKRGAWSKHEVWALRQAVCELTDSLAPVSDIPWKKVKKSLPHRTSEQCRKKWYMDVLPQLLQYQSKHGQPIDTDVFVRLIVTKLRKQKVEDFELVDWLTVNKWWSASLNRAKWRSLQKTVPDSLEEEPFQEVVEWLYKSLACKGYRKRDKRVLKHAELLLDAEARNMSESEGEAAVDVAEAEQEEAAEDDGDSKEAHKVAKKKQKGKGKKAEEDPEKEQEEEEDEGDNDAPEEEVRQVARRSRGERFEEDIEDDIEGVDDEEEGDYDAPEDTENDDEEDVEELEDEDYEE